MALDFLPLLLFLLNFFVRGFGGSFTSGEGSITSAGLWIQWPDSGRVIPVTVSSGACANEESGFLNMMITSPSGSII